MVFSKNDNSKLEDIKEFITHIYVYVDDLYKESVPERVRQRPNKDKALLSDSEIITIAVVGEAMGVDSESAWLNYVRKNMKELFPRLCERSRFNRLHRSLYWVIDVIRIKLGSKLDFTLDEYRITDSYPLEVCKFARAYYCTLFKDENASYGYCASKKVFYFGYKVHMLCTLNGYISDVVLTSASTDDRQALWDLLAGYERPLKLIGDKGYLGAHFIRELADERGDILMPLQKRNESKPYPKAFTRLLFKARRRIETSFSQAAQQFNMQRVRAKSLWGLSTRLLSKTLAFNLCFAINFFHNQDMPIAKIKDLIF